MENVEKRRLSCLTVISGDILLDLLKKLSPDIPKDSKFVRWYVDNSCMMPALKVIIESNAFEELSQGCLVPNMNFSIFLEGDKLK
jgi:hypothetical protein